MANTVGKNKDKRKNFAVYPDLICWFFPLLPALIASTLVAYLVHNLFPRIEDWMLIALTPILYILWLLFFLMLCAAALRIMYIFTDKPKKAEYDISQQPL